MSDVRTYKVMSTGGGVGGFLCPPGHWNHTYSLEEYASPRGRKVISICGIGYALNPDSGAAETVKTTVRRIMERATLVYSDLWVRQVYGHFHNMYLPESGSRDASDLLSVSLIADERTRAHLATLPKEQVKEMTREERADIRARYVAEVRAEMDPERHAAVAFVRKYFPDHEVRLDLIADPGKGSGSYPCTKCGQAVQYEARVDALAVFRQANGEQCPKGGSHER